MQRGLIYNVGSLYNIFPPKNPLASLQKKTDCIIHLCSNVLIIRAFVYFVIIAQNRAFLYAKRVNL